MKSWDCSRLSPPTGGWCWLGFGTLCSHGTASPFLSASVLRTFPPTFPPRGAVPYTSCHNQTQPSGRARQQGDCFSYSNLENGQEASDWWRGSGRRWVERAWTGSRPLTNEGNVWMASEFFLSLEVPVCLFLYPTCPPAIASHCPHFFLLYLSQTSHP